jgi:uncharacterized membrane protein YjjB (DUF3815 family)
MILLELVLKDALWSAVAATGFAMLFNVPKRTLVGCALCGALGHAIRTLLLHEFEVSIAWATLLGALAVGGAGQYLAKRYAAPSPIFTVCGTIPMVPGVFAYRTMLGIIELSSASPESSEAILSRTVINAITVGLVLVAIVAGIIAPQILFDRQKPVV